MAENGNGKYTAQQFINAMPGTGGIISAIADKMHCEWHTVDRAIKKYPTVRAARDAARSRVTDRAQHNIIKAINGGDLSMSKWWLQVMDPEFKPEQKVDVTSGGERIRTEPNIDALAEAIAGLKPGECAEGCEGCQS